MSINSASDSSREAILAGHTISGFEQAVVALLQNSLDANATKIEVLVHPHDLSCTVSDNGAGVSHADMEKLGSLAFSQYGGRETTPPAHRKGLSMFALGNTSSLAVASRRRGEFQTWHVLCNSQTPAATRLASNQQLSSGTTVSLSLFMSRHHVRRRQLLQARCVLSRRSKNCSENSLQESQSTSK